MEKDAVYYVNQLIINHKLKPVVVAYLDVYAVIVNSGQQAMA